MAAVKSSSYKASVGFGPWRECAGKRLTATVMNGELTVYIVADPQSEELAQKSGPANAEGELVANPASCRDLEAFLAWPPIQLIA